MSTSICMQQPESYRSDMPLTPPSPTKFRSLAPASNDSLGHVHSSSEDYSSMYAFSRTGFEVTLQQHQIPSPLPSPLPVAGKTAPMDIPTKTTEMTSTTTTSSSSRKRKPADHIPRPKNCFMAYREHMQHQVLAENPGLNNKVVSILVAQMWNKEPEEVKETWRVKAKALKDEHMAKYPDYKFAPKKKTPKTSAPSKPTKTIKKKGQEQKYLTEDLARDLLRNQKNGYGSEGDHDTDFVSQAMRKQAAIFGHYRSSSVDSVGSWASDSTVSTPLLSPYIDSPLSLSPPHFELPHISEQVQYRQPSTLRYEFDEEGRPSSATPREDFERLNHLYTQLQVDSAIDGYSLDSYPTTPEDGSFAHQSPPLHPQQMSYPNAKLDFVDDEELMAMGQFFLENPQVHHLHPNPAEFLSLLNSTIDSSNYTGEQQMAYLEQRRNSQQMLAEFQHNLHQYELTLNGLLEEPTTC